MGGKVVQHVWRREDQPPRKTTAIQPWYKTPSGSTDRESTAV